MEKIFSFARESEQLRRKLDRRSGWRIVTMILITVMVIAAVLSPAFLSAST